MPSPTARTRVGLAPAQSFLTRVAKIEAICTSHKVRMVDAAIQFPLRHAAVISVIPGGQSVTKVDANLVAVTAVIPAALWADLKAAGVLRADAPVDR